MYFSLRLMKRLSPFYKWENWENWFTQINLSWSLIFSGHDWSSSPFPHQKNPKAQIIRKVLKLCWQKARISLVVQLIKNLLAMQETRVWSLGWEDRLEKKMSAHSSILEWEISWTEGAWWATVYGVAKSWTQWTNNTHTHTHTHTHWLPGHIFQLIISNETGG